MAKHTFHKEERLKSRKSIEALFRSGKTMGSPPFRVYYRLVDDLPYPARMTVAVPKRMMKHAVDRNLVKRRTREAYRQHKEQLYEALRENGTNMELIFLYQTSDMLDYKNIKRSVNFLLLKLAEKK